MADGVYCRLAHDLEVRQALGCIGGRGLPEGADHERGKGRDAGTHLDRKREIRDACQRRAGECAEQETESGQSLYPPEDATELTLTAERSERVEDKRRVRTGGQGH